MAECGDWERPLPCVRFRNRRCAEMDRLDNDDAAAYALALVDPRVDLTLELLPSSRWKIEV